MSKLTTLLTIIFLSFALNGYSQNYEELITKGDEYFQNKEFLTAGKFYIQAYKLKGQYDQYAAKMLDSCSKVTGNAMYSDAASELEASLKPRESTFEQNIVIPSPPPTEKPKPEEPIYRIVEQMPEFPGGVREMYRFLGENLKYPADAQRANVQGKIFVRFVVEKDGSIGEKNVLESLGYGCDEELLRVISLMPKWESGRQNGKKVRTYYTLPCSFTLEEEKPKN